MRLTGSLWTIVTHGTSGSGTAKTSSADSVRSISRGAGDVTEPMLPPQGGVGTNRPAGAARRPAYGSHFVRVTKWGYHPCHEHSGPWAAGGRSLDGTLHGPVRADDAARRAEGRYGRAA